MWKIYYTDGTSFTDQDGSPEDAPAKGVALVLQQEGRCNRRVLKLRDWYRWCPRHNRWFECDEYDVLKELDNYGKVVARHGEYMLEADFEKILIASHSDPYIERISPKEPPHPAWGE